MNSKAFTLLGLLFTLVLIPFTVTADQKSDEDTALANEASKDTNPGQVYDSKQGGGGYCGRCCWIRGYRYCGGRCCWPVQEEENMVNEAHVYEANLQGYGGGWGGRGWGGPGWGGGWGGRGWGGGRGGRGWGGRGWGGGWGGRGWGGGWGGRGWGGGWGRRGGWQGVVEEETD